MFNRSLSSGTQFHVLNVKALVGAFNQEKAQVGALSVIMKTVGLFAALVISLVLMIVMMMMMMLQELRQIWQLSDVTKDGCLSLEEFLTAMHLVVLRR